MVVEVPTDTVLMRPFLGGSFSLKFPFDKEDAFGDFYSVGEYGLIIPFFIFLDAFVLPLQAGRSNRESWSGDNDVVDDELFGQPWVLMTLEKTLGHIGIDGRSCLLRFVCEMQRRPLGRYSVVGELVSLMMTPRNETLTFLKDYSEAAEIGREALDVDHACRSAYDSCPVSVFGFLREKVLERRSTRRR
ncbi:uncharacterized protein LOC143025244 [Oratosquilla oratoria]|uniref:uncharacterized protein LOC143025244 n=1 Tax=Oratosquilla oratoria TaxID=337810 RepID=UPI003F76F0E1